MCLMLTTVNGKRTLVQLAAKLLSTGKVQRRVVAATGTTAQAGPRLSTVDAVDEVQLAHEGVKGHQVASKEEHIGRPDDAVFVEPNFFQMSQ